MLLLLTQSEQPTRSIRCQSRLWVLLRCPWWLLHPLLPLPCWVSCTALLLPALQLRSCCQHAAAGCQWHADRSCKFQAGKEAAGGLMLPLECAAWVRVLQVLCGGGAWLTSMAPCTPCSSTASPHGVNENRRETFPWLCMPNACLQDTL